ncbi:DUF4179 domain-containing protein [Cohnella sp. CFH 77786]|uniref:DUF4179 domain-containing protein n=1 Tax=Cohnella sp. CFH 77786 TaxID=2662265 RepID=UPI001C610131|nr:DUF4179 domain-containing protein [Cohnella sp. CFH 77786]MBW5448929.1 DUF4179 domain-containing protein [Cohnella sp. CFH 77786]
MNHELERKIMDAFSVESEIPESVMRKTEAAFEQIRKLKSESTERRNAYLRKRRIWVASIALFGTFMVSILSNDSAVAAIKSLFYKDTGIQKANEHGYSQAVNRAVKKSGVTVQVDRVVVDKTKMAITFQLDFDDASLLNDTDRVFLDLLIHDDKGRPIREDGNPNRLAGAMDWHTDVSLKNNGKALYHLELQSPQGKFDNIKALALDIKSISLYKKDREKPYRVIEGDWKNTFELDEKFTEHEPVKYVAEDNPMIKVISAEMLPTGMSIQFVVDKPVDESILWKVTLIDSKGNIYHPSNTATMDYTADKKDLISMTFDATAFDHLDGLKMRVKGLGSKDEIVNLLKSPAN